MKLHEKDELLKEGYWMPDVGDEITVLLIREWADTGADDWDGLSAMKFVVVNKDGKIQKSSFPPPGLQ